MDECCEDHGEWCEEETMVSEGTRVVCCYDCPHLEQEEESPIM